MLRLVHAVEYDPDQLAQRILRPDRPALADARAAIAGVDDPREAWEVLATCGIVPVDWVEDPRRAFEAGPAITEPVLGRVYGDYVAGAQARVYPADPRQGLSRVLRAAAPLRRGDDVVACGRFDVRPVARRAPEVFPPTLAAVLAIASDAAGVATAEALAREHFGDAGRRVRWLVVSGDELEAFRVAAEDAARGAGTPHDHLAVLARGYFLRGVASDDGAILLVAPELTDDE